MIKAFQSKKLNRRSVIRLESVPLFTDWSCSIDFAAEGYALSGFGILVAWHNFKYDVPGLTEGRQKRFWRRNLQNLMNEIKIHFLHWTFTCHCIKPKFMSFYHDNIYITFEGSRPNLKASNGSIHNPFCLTATNSVTGYLDYFSVFGHLQQYQLVQ